MNSPTVNHSFSRNEALYDTIVHRILLHAMEEKVEKMATLEIILDLPKIKSKR